MAKKTRKKPRKRTRKPSFLKFASIFPPVIVLLCVGCIYLIWLDYRIQSEFEGKRWALPARVYARALDVYAGRNFEIHDFENELRGSGYRQVVKPEKAGQYSRQGNSLDFIKRSFSYWDGVDESMRLRIVFDHATIKSIRRLPSMQDVPVLRIEPKLIGKVYPHHNEDRVLVPYNEVPPFLIDALVAVEDRHFFAHHGLDFRGIARAFFVNIRKGRISQGGSTLTQQLVKNFFLTQERSYWRKINEMFMALLLERRFSKADILSAYINEVYLGQNGARGIHGFGTAAEYYFGRPLAELELEQIALLVGLVKGASYYNPFKHPERAKRRRNLVLQLLQQQNQPDSKTIEQAKHRKLKLTEKTGWTYALYPAYMDLVKRQLLRDYELNDLRNEGLRIFTSLDPLLQDKLERLVESELSNIESGKSLSKGSLQTAVVVMDVSSGEVKGLIGGRDREANSFNRALDAKRSVGSVIKPVIYYTALAEPGRFNLISTLDDSDIEIKQNDNTVWRPKNYDRITHHNVTLMASLIHSYNLATIHLGLNIGLDKVVQTLSDLGLKTSRQYYPSLFLGAVEMSPIAVAEMYQSFANGGFQISATAIREVLDPDGKALQRYPLKMESSLQTDAVYLTNFLMTEVVNQGTARSLKSSMPSQLPLAGKTGTTNDLRDSWFAGFGDDLLSVVWVGKDDNSPTQLTGSSGALKVWGQIMKAFAITPLQLVPPENIAWLKTNAKKCSGLDKVPYIQGYKPVHSDCL